LRPSLNYEAEVVTTPLARYVRVRVDARRYWWSSLVDIMTGLRTLNLEFRFDDDDDNHELTFFIQLDCNDAQ
jgi:hypothetical protein